MKYRATLMTLTVLACAAAAAQDDSAAGKTKIEVFEQQSGAVIIMGYTRVGTLPGEYGAVIAVEARESSNASTGARQHGLLVEVTAGDRVAREDRAYVDYDEIDGLLAGIDYISKVDKQSTALANFQADYRTAGELEISTYSSVSGISAAVKVGAISPVRAFVPLSDLAKLRALIVTAKQQLDVARAAKP